MRGNRAKYVLLSFRIAAANIGKDFEIKKDYPIFFEKIQEKTVLNTKYRKSPMIPIGDKYLV